MNSILEELYHGDLCPQADVLQIAQGESPSYSAFQSFGEQFSQILKTHAPELEPKFQVLFNDLNLSYHTDREAMFHHGFGLAVKLITAALST